MQQLLRPNPKPNGFAPLAVGGSSDDEADIDDASPAESRGGVGVFGGRAGQSQKRNAGTKELRAKREPIPSTGLTDLSAEGVVEPRVIEGSRAPKAKRGPLPSACAASASAERIGEHKASETRGTPRDFIGSVSRFLRLIRDTERDLLRRAGTTDASTTETTQPSVANAWGSLTSMGMTRTSLARSGNATKRGPEDYIRDMLPRRAHKSIGEARKMEFGREMVEDAIAEKGSAQVNCPCSGGGCCFVVYRRRLVWGTRTGNGVVGDHGRILGGGESDMATTSSDASLSEEAHDERTHPEGRPLGLDGLDIVEALCLVGKGGCAASGSSPFMDITVDSGVAESTLRLYWATSGSILMNQGGGFRCRRKGDLRMMTVQLVDVTSTVASTGRLTAKGRLIALGDEDADREQKSTGRLVNMPTKCTVFIMRAKVMPDACQQQGDGQMDTDVLNEWGRRTSQIKKDLRETESERRRRGSRRCLPGGVCTESSGQHGRGRDWRSGTTPRRRLTAHTGRDLTPRRSRCSTRRSCSRLHRP